MRGDNCEIDKNEYEKRSHNKYYFIYFLKGKSLD